MRRVEGQSEGRPRGGLDAMGILALVMVVVMVVHFLTLGSISWAHPAHPKNWSPGDLKKNEVTVKPDARAWAGTETQHTPGMGLGTGVGGGVVQVGMPKLKMPQGDLEKSVLIMLQQSPVDPQGQLDRLAAIDRGWAQWAPTQDIRVFAARDTGARGEEGETDKAKALALKVVVPISVRGREKEITAMSRLSNGLLELLSAHPSAWLLLANDHAFVIPLNLKRFLAQLDPADMAYSGTKLALHYRAQTLLFASGGAGLVLSHTAAKLMVLVWTLADLDCMPDVCSLASEHTGPAVELDEEIKGTGGSLVILYGARLQAGLMPPLLCRVRKWVKSATEATTVANPNNLRDSTLLVTLSSKWGLLLEVGQSAPAKSGLTVALVALHEPALRELTDPRELGKVLRTGQPTRHPLAKLKQCSASDKWSHTNPGVVMSYCLFTIFSIPFTSSRNVEGAERFHVYGPVRSLVGELDHWYMEAKTLAKDAPPPMDKLSHSLKGRPTPNWPAYRFAVDTISYHYISQMESGLLYRYLSGGRRNVPQDGQAVMDVWPAGHKETGPYSRDLDDTAEAGMLLGLLSGLAEDIESHSHRSY